MKLKIEMNIHEVLQVLNSGALYRLVEDIKELNDLAKQGQAPDNLTTSKDVTAPSETASTVAEKPQPETTPEEHTPEPQLSEVEIRAKFVELSKKGKKKELKALLGELGVEKVSDIQPEQYQEAWSKLEAL